MSFQIEKIAGLARLNLKPDEAKKLDKDMQAILGYIRKLESLDTSKVEVTSHVLDLENVYREDRVCPADVREKALKFAPDSEGYFFKVPKIVDKD